ncbi:unnamed protein product [Ectocarpus sp. 6 AP-2014]
MATAREELTITSETLRLAFSSLKAIDEEVVARTTGVGALPLSQATEMVSQAASLVKTEAVNVLIAVEAVEAAADRAAAAVSATQAAKKAAAEKSAAAKAAVEAAEAAHAAAAALEADLEPVVVMSDKRMTNGGSSDKVDQGATSRGSEVKDGGFNAETKAVESEISAHDGEDNDTCPTVKVMPWAGSTYPEPDDTPGIDCVEGEEQELEKEEEEEEEEEVKVRQQSKLFDVLLQARRGKRKLEGKVNASRRRMRHNYAGRMVDLLGGYSTIESSKRRPMGSAPEGSRGGTGAAATSKVANQGQGKCQEHGCTKWPCFGREGTTKWEFCSKHAKKGMVDIRNKRCAHPGCNKHPSYGTGGTTKVVFCSPHAKRGMVDLLHKRCAHPGCTTRPSYGIAGSKKADFCIKHAKQGMIDVRNKRCRDPGCMKHPSYGTDGTKRSEFCAKHAKQGMVDVVRKMCRHPGCFKYRSSDEDGTNKREFCSKHAK